MKAVVLVGGFGTRLRPLTTNVPKQMLPVVGTTMLEHVLTGLAGHGVSEAVLSMGFLPDAFREAFPDGVCGGVQLHYAVEPEPLDTAGAIRFAALDAGIDERFIAVNGDVFTDLDLGALIDFHDSSGATGTLALTPVDDPSRFGVVPTDDDGKVLGFIEKPPPGEAPTNWINAGSYVLEASVLDLIEDGRKVSIEREIFPALAADGSLYAQGSEAYWVDAGTPESYLQVQLDLIDGVRGGHWPAVHVAAAVADDAVIERSVIEAGATIGAGATVTRSMIGRGAVVEAGASVTDSVVAAGASIGANSEIAELSVIGAGESIAADSVLRSAKVPEPG